MTKKTETIRLRTSDNLLDLLSKGESWAWKVSKERLKKVSHVQVVNFDGTQMIEGEHGESYDDPREGNEHDAVVVFKNARIVNCDVEFSSRNPVGYIKEVCEEA